MKIYTKTGDEGHTQVYLRDTLRVRKDDVIIECYGTLDELNAHIGLLLAQLQKEGIAKPSDIEQLITIQNDLFKVGFAVSASAYIGQEAVTDLEAHIDVMDASLEPQTHFILPGGSVVAAQAHVCRTVCRRAERRIISVAQEHEVSEIAQHYLNRLSDWLFVFARYLNSLQQTPDVPVEN